MLSDPHLFWVVTKTVAALEQLGKWAKGKVGDGGGGGLKKYRPPYLADEENVSF